jgi:protein-L-isoaspartate(D-aspartate) O-methyltransferase
MNIEQARFNMIEQQIRPWEVLDAARAVAAGRRAARRLRAAAAAARWPLSTPRFRWSRKPQRRRPGDAGAAHRSAPAAGLQVQRHEKVLEIGTGSGFMAALLAHRAQQVLTLEMQPGAGAIARQPAAQRRAERGPCGWMAQGQACPADGPFDVILLSGSVAGSAPGTARTC